MVEDNRQSRSPQASKRRASKAVVVAPAPPKGLPALFERAARSDNFDVDALRKLLDLKRGFEADAERRAFDQDFAACRLSFRRSRPTPSIAEARGLRRHQRVARRRRTRRRRQGIRAELRQCARWHRRHGEGHRQADAQRHRAHREGRYADGWRGDARQGQHERATSLRLDRHPRTQAALSLMFNLNVAGGSPGRRDAAAPVFKSRLGTMRRLGDAAPLTVGRAVWAKIT